MTFRIKGNGAFILNTIDIMVADNLATYAGVSVSANLLFPEYSGVSTIGANDTSS